MTGVSIRQNFAAAAGRELAEALRQILPADSRVKSLAQLGMSTRSADRILAGDLPSSGVLLAIFRRYGWPVVRRTLMPAMGDAAELARAERLAKVESQLDDLARTIAELRSTNREGLRGLRALLSFRSADGVGLADDEGRGGVDAGGQVLLGSRGPDRTAARLTVRRQPLSIVEGPHLGVQLARWKAAGGRAERQALVDQAAEQPERRLAVVSDAGPALVFEHISPAFRLYTAADRGRLIGRPTTEAPDLAYARACDINTRGVIETGLPQVDDVSAVIRAGDGVALAIDYRRVVLPYSDGRRRFAVCASEPLAEAA